jgi:hypothetical protein
MDKRDPIDVTAFPACDPSAALAATLAMADGIGALLATARGLLRSGRRVDLSGLEDMCGRLCARSLDLPPEQGRVLAPRLETLQEGLDVTVQMITVRMMGREPDP